MIDWRIYYDDDSTFDSSMGDPADAPGFGVVCVKQHDPVTNATIIWGFDVYYWVPGVDEWRGSDRPSFLIRLYRRRPTGAAFDGALVSNERFSAIMDRAANDPDFPKQSGERLNSSPHKRRTGDNARHGRAADVNRLITRQTAGGS